MVEPPTGDDRPDNPELFISYASAGLARAATLHDRLAASGLRVWLDKFRLTPGCDWHNEIEAGCNAARIVLPPITPQWNQSEWTRYETYPHDAVIPLLAEAAPSDTLTPPLRRFQTLTLDPLAASSSEWDTLAAAIRKLLAAPPAERAPLFRLDQYERNDCFVGRERFLDALREALHPPPSATRANNLVWAVTGLGGVGKPPVFNEYIHRYDRLYRRIARVDARRDLQMELPRCCPVMPTHAVKRIGTEGRDFFMVFELPAGPTWSSVRKARNAGDTARQEFQPQMHADARR